MTRRIAFMHFHTFQMRRGIETLVVSLSNALSQQGMEVSILTAKRRTTPLVEPMPSVHTYEFWVPRYYAAPFISLQYARHLVRQRYDDVIVFFSDFGERLAWYLVQPLLRKKMPSLVVYLCYPYSGAPHRYRALAASGFFEYARLILADAQYVADDAAAFVQRPIYVVPVGTDPERFRFDPVRRAAIRQQYGYTDQDVVLLNVSALEPRKGPRRVLRVLPDLLPHYPHLRYLILGTGQDEAYLRDQVRSLHLESVVTFAGTTADLPSYYSAADIFIMLPDNEANSVASHEALSCNLPAIVANKGGFLEVMRPDFARLVDVDDPLAVGNAIGDLYKRPDLRQQMGQAGRQFIEQHLSWETAATTLAHLLQT